MRRKIGLASAVEGDADLIKRLFATMQDSEADFTLTFRRLASAAERPGKDSGLDSLQNQLGALGVSIAKTIRVECNGP